MPYPVQPPNRARSLGPPNTLANKLAAQKLNGRYGYPKTAQPAQPAKPTQPGNPTIRGWQNYTGNTMGPVGQYARIPGFGRQFRG